MKNLLLVWISVISSFALTAGYILYNEYRINVPGELGENFTAIAIVQLGALLIITALAFLLGGKRKDV